LESKREARLRLREQEALLLMKDAEKVEQARKRRKELKGGQRS
jgi:hypothetical protein